MVQSQPMERDTRAGPCSCRLQAQLQWVPKAAALQLLGLTVPGHEPRGAAATRLNPSTTSAGGNAALTAQLPPALPLPEIPGPSPSITVGDTL